MEESKNLCHDCGCEIIINNEEISNGKQLLYKTGDKEIAIFKCNSCFEKNQELRNYQKCEVYSRVVGYLRPVQQWHKGKKQEYNDRLEFQGS